MSNVAVVTGALVAGIVGGSLFAAGWSPSPRSAAPRPGGHPGRTADGCHHRRGPSGAAMVMPPGYGPGVMMTSGEPTTPRRRANPPTGSCRWPSPRAQAPIPSRAPTLVKYEVETTGSHGADGRRRRLHLLDVRQHRARPDAASPPGRHRGADAQERPGQQALAQHRPARRDRPRRRRQGDPDRAWRVGHHPLQGAEPRRLRLPLRHRRSSRTTSRAACTA